ncbi:MAG: sulfite exporter TauE/SafE family protein [Clostridia bacterium]|nr:sulfite exporter TauE/SafE family protein [Clostridia bacterium]
MVQAILFFLVSLTASVVGAICGIGGGVIIKPSLELLAADGASTISFLSACTVLAMSLFSVLRGLFSERGGTPRLRTCTPLAIGAVCGGVLGNLLFGMVRSMFTVSDKVGGIQAICLAVITAGTFLYTLFKDKIRTRSLDGILPCLLIGLVLGIVSSFLGIGGGPINLVVLFYFFGMDTKSAAASSLYIILFSQLANIITTVATASIPRFEWYILVLMIAGGIIGGIVGRGICAKIKSKTVDRLFLCLMVVIILISIYNSIRYLLL